MKFSWKCKVSVALFILHLNSQKQQVPVHLCTRMLILRICLCDAKKVTLT